MLMEIKDLGQNTFLVGRNVIKAGVPGMFDLSVQADRDELIRISETLGNGSRSPRIYGNLTVCVLHPTTAANRKRFPNAKYEHRTVLHFRELHDSAKAILRKEFPEYAGSI